MKVGVLNPRANCSSLKKLTFRGQLFTDGIHTLIVAVTFLPDNFEIT